MTSYRGLPPTGSSPEDIARLCNLLLLGKLNAVKDVTLTANQATTVVSDPRLTADSYIGFMPLTANALTALLGDERTKRTVFTASGTFTPDAAMVNCDVVAFGGGGAGGGAAATGVGEAAVGSGGNGGAEARGRFTAAQIGASQTVTIGAAGAGASGAAGGAGGATTLGALLSAKGGEGGLTIGPAAPLFSRPAASPTQSATGDVRGWTRVGGPGLALNTVLDAMGGQGADGPLGGSGRAVRSSNPGAAASGPAAGGGGAGNGASQAAIAGGDGGAGWMEVIEYAFDAALRVSSQGNATATITHANNAQSDRTFRLLIIA